MVKAITTAVAGLLISGSFSYAQRHAPINAATMSPVRAMPAPVNATRFGNILFPGGTPASFPSNLGRTVAGVPYTGVPHGHIGRGGIGRNRTMVVPYAVPVFTGGYGYGYPDAYYAQQQQPNVTVVMPQQPTPTVIINNHYGTGQAPESTTVTTGEAGAGEGKLRVYEATPRQAERAPAPKPVETAQANLRTYVRDEKPNIYSIALKDGTSREAIGYWLKGGDLQFVTPQATIGTVALDQVDISETKKINSERKLEFDLNLP